jgi:polysaccharide biosynthesis protein PslH
MIAPRRVVWLERRAPYPLTSGHPLRSYHLIRELSSRHSVTLLCGSWEDGDTRPLAEICEQVRLVPAVDASNGGARATRPTAYAPPNLAGYRQAIAELSACQPFDVAMGELGFAPLAVAVGTKAAVLDNDDILDELYGQLWRIAPWGPGKLAAFRRWRALRRFERTWLPRADLLTVCSDRDRQRLQRSHGSLPPIRVVPNGVDLEADGFHTGPRDPDMLIMAGLMGWPPNAHGAQFLVRRVMPRIWAERPSARLWLVGRDPGPEVRALASERVVVTGTVPDVRPYRQRAAVELVPLFAGGGTRLKILQAMAAGAPVVSTTVGAAGLALVDGKEVLIANDPDAFAKAVLGLISDRQRSAALALAARRRVEADFGWAAIGRRLAGLVDEAVSARPAR